MSITLTARMLRQAPRFRVQVRSVSTLSNNSHIYAFRDPKDSSSHILTFLSTEPPTPSISIGSTTQLPPTPSSFQENPKFLPILQAVMAEHAHSDPFVQSQAAVMVSSAGFSFSRPMRRQETGSFGASDQGGYGGGGRGGFVHVYDQRGVPDFGRIPDPENIFGSIEVDGKGQFVDGHGRYEASGTYRICTNDGILGLSDFMRQKLVERLKLHEAAEKNQK
ncbi:hypothetical protein LTR20_002028 [Exophiala xenobiotica]|nr:hypothetical protein LTR41_008864 [Exophiala xenobiotica]KAK5258826.1 hypothetical protein LTR40_007131 [Exophiala xenobiotica]KAK5377567.1 hypothetical protein LTS13_004437 [Exophiala xenobiotica]KAK5393577.1 hypothetical protein LTR79_009245 [Exophiala xenobiotica]KAK5420615.1 hypothetical protein LTR90_003508 [Exophiala xenobiotica]